METDTNEARVAMVLVKREEIPAIHEILVDGKVHPLGIHKDFRRHPVLKRHLPENARVSFSWVRLGVGEELAVHAHPTASIIIVASGNGRSSGDLEADFTDGDVIVVPPNFRHGFRGSAPAGYWALSIQLEGAGLYEDTTAARVAFSGAEERSPKLRELIRFNQEFMESHLANPIFAFIGGEHVEDKRKRARLLDAIQVWSNFYQKMVRLRSCLSSKPVFGEAAEVHLAEEFQHNVHLAKDRGEDAAPLWDPVLEAGSSWFVWKMFALDDAERAALVHLVLEGGSTVFHARANKVMARYDETRHFGVHDEADQGHLEIGFKVLEGLPDAKYPELRNVVKEGWGMLNLICARMAELAVEARP